MTGSKLRPGVLFDVDGTLADTNYLHTLAWWQALDLAGEWAPMNAIHRLVGQGGDHLVQNLLGHPVPAAEKARPERYGELRDQIRLFPGAGELLQAVHDRGIAVVLATSAPSDELEVITGLLQRDELIDAVTTADDIESSKPDPEVMIKAMEAADIDPTRAVAIGDTDWDIQAADAAGIPCIGVESGGFSRQELTEAGALQVFRDVGQLVARFWASPLAALA